MQKCQKGSPTHRQWRSGTLQLPYARGLIATGLGSGDNAITLSRWRERERRHVERDSLKWVCQRLAVERGVRSVSPAPAPPSLSRHQGLCCCCIPAGCWGRSARAAQWVPCTATDASGCWTAPTARAVAACRCRWPFGKVLVLMLQLGGPGKCKRHRSIITPCFLTPWHSTIISSLWGRRGMHRSIRQAGDVTLWTQTSRKCFLGTRQHCIILVVWECPCDGNQG